MDSEELRVWEWVGGRSRRRHSPVCKCSQAWGKRSPTRPADTELRALGEGTGASPWLPALGSAGDGFMTGDMPAGVLGRCAGPAAGP